LHAEGRGQRGHAGDDVVAVSVGSEEAAAFQASHLPGVQGVGGVDAWVVGHNWSSLPLGVKRRNIPHYAMMVKDAFCIEPRAGRRQTSPVVSGCYVPYQSSIIR
jgi:hypothetical protein